MTLLDKISEPRGKRALLVKTVSSVLSPIAKLLLALYCLYSESKTICFSRPI